MTASDFVVISSAHTILRMMVFPPTAAVLSAGTFSLKSSEITRRQGVRKPAIHIPMPLMFLGAAPPVTARQLRMLREGVYL